MQVESGWILEDGKVLCGPVLVKSGWFIADKVANIPHAKQAALRRAGGILMVSSVQMQSPRSLLQVSTALAGVEYV
jgi:hypothetical protein